MEPSLTESVPNNSIKNSSCSSFSYTKSGKTADMEEGHTSRGSHQSSPVIGVLSNTSLNKKFGIESSFNMLEDKKRQCSLDLVISDSPLFRATIQLIEDDLEEISKWLDVGVKGLRHALENAASKEINHI